MEDAFDLRDSGDEDQLTPESVVKPEAKSTPRIPVDTKLRKVRSQLQEMGIDKGYAACWSALSSSNKIMEAATELLIDEYQPDLTLEKTLTPAQILVSKGVTLWSEFNGSEIHVFASNERPQPVSVLCSWKNTDDDCFNTWKAMGISGWNWEKLGEREAFGRMKLNLPAYSTGASVSLRVKRLQRITRQHTDDEWPSEIWSSLANTWRWKPLPVGDDGDYDVDDGLQADGRLIEEEASAEGAGAGAATAGWCSHCRQPVPAPLPAPPPHTGPPLMGTERDDFRRFLERAGAGP
jgi:hypothetical protein